jgi:hypothetical protein
VKTGVFFIDVKIDNDHAFTHNRFSLHLCYQNLTVWKLLMGLSLTASKERFEVFWPCSLILERELQGSQAVFYERADPGVVNKYPASALPYLPRIITITFVELIGLPMAHEYSKADPVPSLESNSTVLSRIENDGSSTFDPHPSVLWENVSNVESVFWWVKTYKHAVMSIKVFPTG